MSIDELIRRVEGASGPDRDLDREIARLQGLRIVNEGHPIGRVCYDANGHAIALPAYTRSLDAAMALVPEGERFELHNMTSERVLSFVSAPGLEWDDFNCVSGVTPALALTAAALCARALASKPAEENPA